MSNAPVRYFGGTTVHQGRVSLLRATTFKDLVESYIFVPVSIPMTRHDFLAHPDRDKLKDGAYICAASFPWEEGHRDDASATLANMVIVDLDAGQVAKDFFESPETLREALTPFSFACWTTAKHTPEAPRIKIAIELKPCDKSCHRRVALMLLRRLGLPRKFPGSRETLTLSLPQYRPVVFDNEPFTAVIASRTNGQPVDETDAPEIVEEADEARVYAYEGEDGLSGLAFLPIVNLAVEDIREPLFAIDPDCPYQIWVSIACALRHNFPDEDSAREAYHIFDEWSATGSKYRGESDTFGKWRSFKPAIKDRNPITIRTLYKFAMDAGWSNAKLAVKIKTQVLEWIANCADVNVLMREGPRRIAEMPFKSEMEEEVIGDTLLKRLASFGTKVSKTTLMKEIRSTRFRDKTESVREEHPAWILPFCFIGPANTFRNIVTGSCYSPEAFNNTFSRFLVPDKSAESDDASSKPLVLPTQKALNEAKIKVVDAELYDPRESGKESFFESKGLWFVNTYRKSSMPNEEPAHAAYAGKLFRKLLKANLGNDHYERIFLDWFAFVVQNPGVLVRWAIFMQGAQGCGKGTLGDCLAAAIGSANFKLISAAAMASDFNDWRSGAQVVYVDEIKSPGKNRHEIANKLKDCVTNSVIPVNQKFKDVTNIPNVTNYILTTNNIDALAMEDDDRRYFVLISLIQLRSQVQALMATGLIQKIHKLIVDHPGAFRSYFLSHEISANFALNGPAPETIHRQQFIDESKNPVRVLLEDLIASTDHPLIGNDVIHSKELHELTSHASASNHKPTHFLPTLGFSPYAGGKRFSINGRDTAIWVSALHDDFFGTADEVLRERAKDGTDIL